MLVCVCVCVLIAFYMCSQCCAWMCMCVAVYTHTCVCVCTCMCVYVCAVLQSLCYPPLAGFQLMKDISMLTVTYTVISTAQLQQTVQNIRKKLHTEGSVLYVCNSTTKCTIGLWKVKSSWYVYIRALRQKAQRDASVERIHTRFNQIQKWFVGCCLCVSICVYICVCVSCVQSAYVCAWFVCRYVSSLCAIH